MRGAEACREPHAEQQGRDDRQQHRRGEPREIRPPREHLAVVKPFNDILMLETMHFADELRSPKDVKAPSAERSNDWEPVRVPEASVAVAKKGPR